MTSLEDTSSKITHINSRALGGQNLTDFKLSAKTTWMICSVCHPKFELQNSYTSNLKMKFWFQALKTTNHRFFAEGLKLINFYPPYLQQTFQFKYIQGVVHIIRNTIFQYF
jgi:hypothetical protein